ncbi:MAG: sulfurtransferase TusA family protein [Burkholderiaceae bacterium]|nr:sulfurtransferase TusA family protein [Burkholderiaceae bacterium]
MNPAHSLRPGVILDLSGVSCPGPILGAKKLVMELAMGEVLLLISDCPATSDELHTWAERTGNEVVRAERLDSGATGYYVRRGQHCEPHANVTLDMRGSSCPGPIIEAKKMLQAMAPGEILKLVSNCPGSRADVEDWARITGHRLEDVIEIGRHEWEFFIRRAGNPPGSSPEG